ncbi:hypothetical protein VTN96DRAFT_5531 [Rasamsonia emersonii]|uniref:Uncharacterized protein n=1 Tax=Rasamsonia emersonii (strain ATCC 16479 / CBS 393.64 / IMI 116815) TaxID=1408163 RepID=A0A0F4YHH5_RASE3|nr:hypothetical protein T310_8441 [Rasamsonia emersonii CBS 393.64]KKA17619.1 hypothetical protein T310_8441 [Rasamsonia emersonii CBS 393.64]
MSISQTVQAVWISASSNDEVFGTASWADCDEYRNAWSSMLGWHDTKLEMQLWAPVVAIPLQFFARPAPESQRVYLVSRPSVLAGRRQHRARYSRRDAGTDNAASPKV